MNATTSPVSGADNLAAKDSQRLRRQYVAALSQFIHRLSLPPEALQRVKACLSSSRSSPVEALLDQLAEELQTRTAYEPDDVAEAGADDTAIQNVLLTLFDRITLSPATEVSATRHKEALLAGIAPDDLPRFVNDLADLISQNLLLTQREKKKLEDFIAHVLGQLNCFESFVQDTKTGLRESRENHAVLQTDWAEEAQQMAARVSQATDLGQLKLDVNAQLQRMRDCMAEHHSREEERIRRSERANISLGEQLHDLASETSQLREQLQDSRTRLLQDPVTGVHSRFAYEERMELEFNRWQRGGTPLALLLWDIDFFKSINDTFGHRAGDRVLTLVAQLIDNRVREGDFFARVGGEEFVMLMPGTNLGEAMQLAEDIRVVVADSGFNHKGSPVPITLCCGITECRSGDTPSVVFERADEALYRAKQAGRNCCMTA